MLSKPGAQPNQSLINGIRTLQMLAVAPDAVGCRALARELGLDVTKVNRLLKTLAHLGIVRQTADRKYTAGPGMHVLAAQSLFASGLIGRTIPALERLRRFGHTVAMGVLWNDSVSYLYHAPPGVDPARALARIGVLPASNSGIGVALLAQLTDVEVEKIYADRTDVPGHPDGKASLLKQLADTRNRGYARVLVSPDEGRHTIAVVLGSPAYAAIGISGWLPDSGTHELVEALGAVAADIA
jgi:DNA-binding IclR family transcriptional regulator